MKEDLDLLISRYLEGLADDEEVRRLDELLRRDSEAQKAFFLAADQDVELRRILTDERDAEVLESAAPAPARPRFLWAAAGVAAAALVAAALALLWPRPPSPELAPEVTYGRRPAPSPRPPAAPAKVKSEAPAPAPDDTPPPAPAPAAAPKADQPAVAAVPDAGKKTSPRPAPIEIEPVAPIPKGRSTVMTVAALAEVHGKVLILSPGVQKPARAGQEVLLDTGLETPEDGVAVVRYPDGTEIKLDNGTRVDRLSGNGKHLHLSRGFIYASVAPQPADQPLVVATPQARAEVLGTRFTVAVGADATRLEVDDGRVRLTRPSDGASVEVGAGFRAIAAPNWALRAVPQEGVDAVKVEAAIQKGIQYLNGKRINNRNGNVLLFLTYVHAGAADSDPEFQALLKDALETELEHTYQVALTAMAFEEFQRVRYQNRILQCAQFLADNIGPKGQTRYGVPTTYTEGTPTTATGPAKSPKVGLRVYDTLPAGAREKPPVTRFLQVRQKRPGPSDHDHSNMQYAALGLRACHDAGIRFETALLKLIEEWWRDTQETEAGKEEVLLLDPPSAGGARGPGSTKALTTAAVAAQGWGYTKGSETRGSMTAGAVGAMCILSYMQGKDWRHDKDVLEGLQWISRNFSVTENPKVGDKNWLYYLYGLERAGMLYGTETIGSHRWYPEGAKVLLEKQSGDGKWNNAVDTCFAILFLKRATRPLVASEDALRKK